MTISTKQLERLRTQALSVLRSNDLGSVTQPAPHLYPHQWNWDSAFIAIGLSRIDAPRAQLEIESLLAGQWKNGMVPHINFNRDAATYYPGPEFWDIGLSADAPDSALTSGITQPPVLAWSAHQVYLNSRDKDAALHFLDATYGQLVESFRFFRLHRTVDDSGLVCIVHPWESGLDNSPVWDTALERISPGSDAPLPRTDISLIPDQERPTGMDYDRYIFLVNLFKQCDYSQARILDDCPFLIQPVMFNALLNRDLEAILEIGELLGRADHQIIDWYKRMNGKFDSRFLDPTTGHYQDYDCRAGTNINKHTFSGFTPIITGIPSAATLTSIVANITSETYWPPTGFPLPTVAMNSDYFDPVKYWRGPVWININWLIIQGFLRHGYKNQAFQLMDKTIELVHQNGFFEYFHPLSGKGHGAANFSWTAALIIDLIVEYSNMIKDGSLPRPEGHI